LTQVELPYLAVARVSGADAGAFLQAQLSADIAALADGGSTFACYCSPRGQVFGLLLVCRVGEEFRLVADRGLLPGMVKRLGLFVLRARVVLEMQEALAVQGCKAAPDRQGLAGEFEPHGLGLAYRLLEWTPDLEPDQGRWREQELRKGVVWLGAATSERFIPQMLGMDVIGAVSFSKGCYPGQEIIARTQNLGSVKKRLEQLQSAAPGPAPPAGTVLADPTGRTVGTVVRAASAGDTVAVLAVVELAARAARLHTQEQGVTPLELSPLADPREPA
jgi:folate-binding protein YgfZ